MRLQKKILERELKRLVEKYGRGKELDLEWIPQRIERYYSTMGMIQELKGELVREEAVIKVYTEDLEEALDVVVHEFFEYIFDQLLHPIDILFNEVTKGYKRAFNRIRYKDKESIIKLLVKIEKEERKKCRKKTSLES